MAARKTGTASRTRTASQSTSRTASRKSFSLRRILGTIGSAKRWSTRRVAAITTALVLFISNPVTIMAAVVWVQTTVTDWHTAAIKTGLL